MSLQREILSPVTTNLENSLIRVCRPFVSSTPSTSIESTSLIGKGSADCKFWDFTVQKQSAQHGSERMIANISQLFRKAILPAIQLNRIQTPISNGGRLRLRSRNSRVRPALWFRKLLKALKYHWTLLHMTLLMLCHTRLLMDSSLLKK